MTHVKTLTHHLNTYRKGIVMLAALCVGIFAMLYVYFINTTVLHVVARQKYAREIADLTTTVAKLETENTNLKSTVTLDQAVALGFSESTHVAFISRAGQSLTYNGR